MQTPFIATQDRYRADHIRETFRSYATYFQLRQEERVAAWGEYDGGILRRLEVHDTRDGRTLTLTFTTALQGPNATNAEATHHLQFGVEHLDELIADLTRFRNDQAERAKEEDDWNFTHPNGDDQ